MLSPNHILEQKLRVALAARTVIAKEFMESLRCNNIPMDDKQMATMLKLVDLVAPMPFLQVNNGENAFLIYCFMLAVLK